LKGVLRQSSNDLKGVLRQSSDTQTTLFI
jgi:hypothetical protein